MRTLGILLLVSLLVAGPLAHQRLSAVEPRTIMDAAPEPGLTFDRLSGNEWWLQARVTGTWAPQVHSVQAMDTDGPWVPLAPQPWSDCDCWWAGSFSIEPGHQVRLRAMLTTGLVIDSCWSSHPGGLTDCAATTTIADPVDPDSLTDVAAGTGRVLVGFVPGTLPPVVAGQAIMGLPVVARIPQIDALVVAAPDLLVARTLLGAMPGLAYIEADGWVHASTTSDGPNDPRFSGQYGPVMVGLPAAWSEVGYGSPAVIVAVIDSGITRTHPDFQGANILTGRDYVNNDADPNDDCGHGTHVSGIIAARTDNGVGIAGASQATLLPLKALGSNCSGWLSNVARAVVDATDQGAHIITMSLGTSTNSKGMSDAVAYAWDHGVLIAASAGNAGRDNSVHFPAAYSQVIAVSAMDENGGLASYSSRGPQVEVAAPGTRIDSTTRFGGYGLMTGTSMATPHVAGALALALSCHPEATHKDLRDTLVTTAEDLGPAGRDAGFGHGMLRADRLVQETCDTPPTPQPTPTTSPTPTALPTLSPTSSPSPAPTSSPTPSPTSSPTPAPTASPPPSPTGDFAAIFTPSKGSNEWWVEVSISSNTPLSAVAVRVNDGAWQALPRTSWGSWASSFFVATGASVVFQATDQAGDTALSSTYSWLGPAPPAGPFAATFTPKAMGNAWWIEVDVASNHDLLAVDVRLHDGPWQPLPKTSWGSWAKSIHTDVGTDVQFRATSAGEEARTSATYTWR